MAKTKILIYTGKGGVGKTTVSSATALLLAKAGKKTLIASTDPAHSLGDSLQTKLEPEPVQIHENLWGVEVDEKKEMNLRFDNIRTVLLSRMRQGGMDTGLAEEILAFPGAAELFCLLKVADIKAENEFDAIVLDTAPTGNTMRFLHFPEFLAPVEHALKVEQGINKVVRPIAKLINKSMPKDSFYRSIFELLHQIEEARRVLFEATTLFRFVLNPDHMSLVETQRAISSLNISGYAVDCVIVNKVLPQEIRDSFFDEWKSIQKKSIQEAKSKFYPLKVLKAPLADHEVVGMDKLISFGKQLYDGILADTCMCEHKMYWLSQEENESVLHVRVPYDVREDLKMHKEGGDLIVKIGMFSQKLCLPAALIGKNITGAKLEETVLKVGFR